MLSGVMGVMFVANEPEEFEDLDDEEALEEGGKAVLVAVGRQIRLWRTAAGLSQPEFGRRIGYGENMVYKVETGARIPRPEFLDRSDAELKADGKISAMKEDVKRAKYPKKLPALINLENRAVELGAYGNHNLHGLLQTEEYSRALYEEARPAHASEAIEKMVQDRLARQEIFTREPATTLTFVQEEATLRRPIGGRSVMRRQLKHVLGLSKLRNVEFQVMPTDTEEHAGMEGELQLLKVRDGRIVGYSEAQSGNRLVSDPKSLQVLELRYGIIRSQALTPRRSQQFIETLLGDGTC